MESINLTKTHDVIGAYKQIDFSGIRKKYADPGTEYAFKVLDGDILAGYHIRLAAFRHLRDLQRQNTPGFEYHYDTNEVKKIITFASACPEVESKTKQPVKLMLWQKFILSQLVGWRNKYDEKRFSQAIVSVARHNGKTYLMAIVLAYAILVESMITDDNGDIDFSQTLQYLVSSINYKQTSQLFGYLKEMLQYLYNNPLWAFTMEKLGISKKTLQSQADQIHMTNTHGRVIAMSYESGQYNGFHFSTAVLDEAGDPKVQNKKTASITSGQHLGVTSPQYVRISTAYDEPLCPFHMDEKRIIEQMEKDYDCKTNDYLVLDWSQDGEDEIHNPETWIKSNPLIGLAKKHDKFLGDLKDSLDTAEVTGQMNEFINKTMNYWTSQSADSFLKYQDIQRAKVKKPFNIHGATVYVGFDYSMSDDNTAFGFVQPFKDESGQVKFRAWQKSFIPWMQSGSITTKEKKDGMAYRELAKKGYCEITKHEKGLISADQVYNWLLDYIEENNLHVIFFGYDARGVTTIIKMLDNNTDLPLEAIRQRTLELKDPTKFLQRLFVEGNIEIPNDPILEKALVNAEIYSDKVGIQVSKPAGTYKIDVVDAIIDALYQAMYHFEDFGYANDKSKQVERMTAKDMKEWFDKQGSGLFDEDDPDDDDWNDEDDDWGDDNGW